MPAPAPERIAVLGGVYSNYLALDAVIRDARKRGVSGIYCLGDLGAFGPHPDRVWPILEAGRVLTIRGNYEEALASGAGDCQCGYTDPRDNLYARISYDYTAARTSEAFKRWMGRLPGQRRLELGGRRLLLCHGSPRRTNEFLWETSTSTAFLEKLLDDHEVDGILCDHTGLPWSRVVPGGRSVVNVGAVGRPPNDGRPDAVYALIEAARPLRAEFRRVAYDHERLAREIRAEELPGEFAETIVTGWWTTCLEILPAKERARGRF